MNVFVIFANVVFLIYFVFTLFTGKMYSRTGGEVRRQDNPIHYWLALGFYVVVLYFINYYFA